MPAVDNLRHRSKKFVSSKTAGTKIGRKLILKLIGEDGEKIFNTVKEAAKIHYGDKRGKQIKEDMLKMIMKVDIMQKHNQLTPETTASSVDPTHKALFQAHKDFTSSCFEEDGNNKKDGVGPERRDAAPLSQATKEMATSWEVVITPFMKPTNLDTFRQLMASLSDQDFLDALLNKSEFFEHRSTIGEAFAQILETWWGIERGAQFVRVTKNESTAKPSPRKVAPSEISV